MIKVLVAEDMHVVRAGLAEILDGQLGIEVAGQAADGPSALETALRHGPDVAVLDIDLPGLDGIAVAGRLRERLPACRCLMLTALDRPGLLRRALDAGAAGYLLKTATPGELASAVRTVAAGGRAVDPRLAERSSELGENPLTAREAEVLRLSASGAGAREIAAELFLGVGTVRNRISSAVGKLHARTLVDAVRIAERNGWI
ncbi:MULTISPECIES: response regulator transcription factor [Streptomyces]|uniref:Two-component system, NarL family, response regulator DesR n=1 Tax=Streptomyces radiopugnans TaxID=403935 RepID=A0A1H9J2A0_9ACTN|nr:response regulator transcription factor [Streptomyces radiopugnans]URN13394.1 response regulator transcription factor [Streptomyces radiopugnans]SEQ80906.1 two-component system, NarL family, response regulator DesR [Streptomyces radiopugnans]